MFVKLAPTVPQPKDVYKCLVASSKWGSDDDLKQARSSAITIAMMPEFWDTDGIHNPMPSAPERAELAIKLVGWGVERQDLLDYRVQIGERMVTSLSPTMQAAISSWWVLAKLAFGIALFRSEGIFHFGAFGAERRFWIRHFEMM